ncbi:hypothetical protein BJ741DRAFT_626464 [Chytriomyces cf. hyalinus JEL632]|nr:hypothetical protein BJ741DRAFT_626464 [Chytriomyces cf. hyalinus JEL632]
MLFRVLALKLFACGTSSRSRRFNSRCSTQVGLYFFSDPVEQEEALFRRQVDKQIRAFSTLHIHSNSRCPNDLFFGCQRPRDE